MSNTVEIDVTDNTIDAVCVYQADRAEIKRTFQVELTTGQNEVCVTKLPSCLDGESIRVEGVGNAVIFDVIYSPPPKDSKPKGTEETKALRDEISKLESDRAILQEQSGLLEGYSKSLKSDKSDIGALNQFFSTYTEQKRDINSGLVKVNEELDAAQKKLDEKLRELRADDEESKRSAKVTIIVLAEKGGKAELSLWYRASWSPLYDLRAKISNDKQEKPSVSLHYRGSISQSTGEDWSDVALTLSTASPLRGTDIPTLAPYRIGFERPVAYTMSFKSAGFGGAGRDRERSRSSRPAARSGTFALPNAKVTEGATSSTFSIEGQSNIPSSDLGSSKAHKVTIAVIDLVAKLEWIAVPKEQTSAFLRCQVKNTSQYPLLDGPSSVFMDNNFVCKSRIPDVSPQETFSTSLGADPSIRITYHPLSKVARNSSGGLLSSKHDISSFVQRITVKNTRTTAVSPLFIKDQIPVSVNSAYKVTLNEPQELGVPKDRKEVQVATGVKARWARKGASDADIDAEEKEKEAGGSKFGTIASRKEPSDSVSDPGVSGVEEEGVLEWVCNIDGGKGVDLTLSWDIVSPAGQPWVRGA
ncbi:hypothetical protein FRC04_005847 [Tulasnella sp. 424]|nr:hypothetical protein FRC04_005847 [Tulasnella sp. 424]KAG8975992.1 hypothetical protein FRC05_004622 [Tulasnella sp. 425]